jgi:hypothetical protein
MSTIRQSARGASFYTHTVYHATGPLDERGLLSERIDAPGRTWSDVIGELLAVRNLQDDWDGQGAKTVNPALVDGAITLALHLQASGLPPADFAIAGVNGTVFFEWHDPTRFLEIEVTAPDQAEGRSVRKGSDEVGVFALSRWS